ncbi:hypothetical protein [Aquimarina litoralis]|uniref:hypothetical protein n=1 Tax=Aquimarina litoralis TaxID=584605 RepID=UPI001C59A94C|nr:hypothetical protein [Aquimarina litoralis]MBW1296368.1 hypothetical protein [Aquimarina litoralis]
MKNTDYEVLIKPIVLGIAKNKKTSVKDRNSLTKTDQDQISEFESKIPSSIMNFYRYRNGFLWGWIKSNNENPEIFGRINILELKHLFDDTVITLNQSYDYTFNGKSNEKIKLNGVFRPLDYFTDEACVGFFSDYNSKNELYYHDFGASFYSLKVDFEGYFKLLTKSYGYAYWQQVILNKEYNYGTDTMERFKEDMPNLFPDFDFNEFLKLYESVKIK